MSRESRLLLVTIGVSATVLLLLAQFRFPDPPTALPSGAPLERLAARASFEDLATRVAQLETAIAPNLIVLRLGTQANPTPVRLTDLLPKTNDIGVDSVRHVPALRIDQATAIAVVPPATAIAGIVGADDAAGAATVTAIDPVRGLARLQVPERSVRTLPQRPLGDLATPAYVVAVEGTAAGVTLRPVFLGRSDRFRSPRWSQPLLPLGGIVVTPGALFFTLDGEFLGAAIAENGSLAIAGADEALQLVARLQAGAPPIVDPGVSLQPITSALANVVGADGGVLVAEVADGSAAADALAPGDVITDVGGQPAGSPEAVLLALSTGLQSGPIKVTVRRQGTTVTATLRPAAPSAENGRQISLQTVPGIGARVLFVASGSALANAGVREGDLILRAGTVDAPSAGQVESLLQRPSPDVLPLVVRRADRRRVIFVPAAPANDGPR